MCKRSSYETEYIKEQAERANLLFDNTVKQFLRAWIERGTVSAEAKSADAGSDTEAFIEHGALRSFFAHRHDAFEQLLQQEAVARHLLRPIDEVHFENDAYEPMLAKFERRMYNLAVQREHLEVSFRYSPPNRQGAYGDTILLSEMPADQVREDIGTYFGTRRSDAMALTILGDQLRNTAHRQPGRLPVHVVTEGYMEDSLRAVKRISEHCHLVGDYQLRCFVIQRRHAADDRHLGAALLVMNPRHADKPQRIIFCDTLNPSGQPPWWNKFKHKVDAVFPQSEGHAPVSDYLEDGGVNLQRLHDGVPIRHQDIDCAFYTASIVQALIQVVKTDPELILNGRIQDVVTAMTGCMTDYFEKPNTPKDPAIVREASITYRWNTGREAIKTILQAKTQTVMQASWSTPSVSDHSPVCCNGWWAPVNFAYNSQKATKGDYVGIPGSSKETSRVTFTQ